jgi:nitronate monooxygenase
MGIDAERGRMVTCWPDRRFLELVGCKHPIVQAPMANAGGVDLCVGAIEGGALGSLPCGMLSPDQVREQVRAVRERVPGPLNLNFLCHSMPPETDDSAWVVRLEPYYAEFGLEGPAPAPPRAPFDEAGCVVVEELRPDVVSFHFGLPDEHLLSRVKATGAVILSTATTVDEAKWLCDQGVNAVIAQGFEAGGHSGHFLGADPAEALGLFALLPQVADAVDVPVIAAGGIADERGILAALALGASAVQMGTAFLRCPESLLPNGHRALLGRRQTIRTTVYSGGLARAVRGRLVDELGPTPDRAPPFPLAGRATMPLFAAALQRGDFELLPTLAGQAAALAPSMPAAELVRRLAARAEALIVRQEVGVS